MRVLISGGLGFIGSNLIRYLLSQEEDGLRMTNVDNMSLGSNPDNLRDVEKDPRYRFVKADINDEAVLRDLVREVDAVINVAAQTHVDRSIADPWPFIRSNNLGVANLLELMRRFNDDVRFLQVSTDEVYGRIQPRVET